MDKLGNATNKDVIETLISHNINCEFTPQELIERDLNLINIVHKKGNIEECPNNDLLIDVYKQLRVKKTMPRNLLRVIWRNWVLPLIITAFCACILSILFNMLPKNIIATDFMAGWISCSIWCAVQKHYKI